MPHGIGYTPGPRKGKKRKGPTRTPLMKKRKRRRARSKQQGNARGMRITPRMKKAMEASKKRRQGTKDKTIRYL